MTAGVTLDEFRETFSSVPAPVSVVTALHDGKPYGTTVSSFCSLSASPPLVLVALDRASNTLAVVTDTRRFGVNVLSATQDPIARTCAGKGEGKFVEIEWREDTGLPRIEETTSWLACELRDQLPGGDHVILTGLVVACDYTGLPPLVYHRRTYSTPGAV